MSKIKAATPALEAPAPSLDTLKINRGAFNLDDGFFVLGEQAFPLKDLSYDSYVIFLGYLTPLIEVVVQKIAGGAGISIPGIDLNANAFSTTNILKLCSKELPEMVHLMCKESDSTITVEDVKKLAGRPTTLVTAIVKQIHKNQMIQDFADFFAQVLSVVKPLTPVLNQSTSPTAAIR